MKSRKLLLSLAVFFLVGAFAPMKASSVTTIDGEEGNEGQEAAGWVPIGPNNISGRVRALVFDRFNDNVMYAGTVGGLFVSVNGGNNWREVNFSNGTTYAVTSIAQADNGTIYIGTGEGFYNDYYLIQNNRKGGSIGGGVFAISTGSTDWAAALESDEAKYEYVANNFSASLVPGTKPDKYDVLGEYSFVNDVAAYGDKVYIATRNGGLKLYDGTTVTNLTIDGNSAVNVTDIKINREGKVAIAFRDANAKVALGNVNDNVFRTIFAPGTEELPCYRIELAFGMKNNNMLYALAAAGVSEYASLYGVYKADVNQDNVQFGNRMSSSNLSLGLTMDEAMSIAVNDLEEEYVYVAGWMLQKMFDANGADVFYAEQQTYYYWNSSYDGSVTETDGSYVAPNIHTILFKENPTTLDDSLAVYLATDAGVYCYGKDMTQNYVWQPRNKGLNCSQYYNVAVGADGSVMGAAQSNAINYIPTPSAASQKSADKVWSPISPGAFNYDTQNFDGGYYAPSINSQTGTNVVGSAIHTSLPNVRKPFVMLRSVNGLTRTYSNEGDFVELNDQTWHFGSGNAMLMNPQMVRNSGYGPLVCAMDYWENFNAPAATVDSVDFTFKVALNAAESSSATRIIRGGQEIALYAGLQIFDGDTIVAQSYNLDYPFVYRLTAERFGVGADNALNIMIDEFGYLQAGDTTVKIPNPIQARLFVSTANGVYVCKEIMNFRKTYYDNTVESLPWVRLFNVNGKDGNLNGNGLYLNPVRAIAASPDGNSVLIAVEHTQSGTSDLVRVSGLNEVELETFGANGFGGTRDDVDNFTTDTLATFDRIISSISYAKDMNSDVAFISFAGTNPSVANVQRVSGLSGNGSATFENIPVLSEGSSEKPVFTVLADAFSNRAYIGTDDGIYETQNRNAANVSWTRVEGVPEVAIYDLCQQTQNLPPFPVVTYLGSVATQNMYEGTKYSGAIYAASYGKGLFMNRDNLQTPLDTVHVSVADVVLPEQNDLMLYPNPAANFTTMNYSLATSSSVVMNIFDMNGRLVSSLDKGTQSAGSHTQQIDLNAMQKGVYMIQIVTNGGVKTAKLIVQ